MTANIEISKHPSGGAIVRPAEFLGRELFGSYLNVVRLIPDCVYEPAHRRQRLKDLTRLPGLIADLEDAGFAVLLAPELASTSSQVAEELSAERARVVAQMQRAEERIKDSGLAPYPFQRDGILWLAARKAGLLGDEMGLGKTVQALLAIPEDEHAVVVCPSSLKGNWAQECLRWRPDLKPTVLKGKGSFRWPTSPRELVIINDDVLPDPEEQEIPPSNPLLIYDEAHRGKGGKRTLRGKRFLALRDAAFDAGGRVLLLTGTPLINKPKELKAVLDLAGLFKEAFGSWPKFNAAFPEGRAPRPEAAEGLRKVSLARLREDVLPDLPTKTWQEIEAPIGGEMERKLDAIAAELASKGFPIETLNRDALKEPVVFELISRIRAALATAKIPAMLEVVEQHEEEEQPLVVFSAHRAPIDLLGKRKGWATITGDTPAEERTEIVRRFQGGDLLGIAGTIRAMGVGVTLTHAHRCLFVDLDWTPAGNSQAEDRLCRIGQQSAVLITTLIARHEMDHRVTQILQEKKVIIDGSVGEAARGTQQQAADLLADLERREAQARAQEEQHRARAEAYAKQQQQREEEERKARELLEMVKDIPSGGYALEESKRVEYWGPSRPHGIWERHVTFWRVDRPEGGRWAGWLFLSRQEGPNRVAAGGLRPNGTPTAKNETLLRVLDVLKKIAADPFGSAQLYGRELGVCGVCGSELTNDESRALGIGPVCREKFSAA